MLFVTVCVQRAYFRALALEPWRGKGTRVAPSADVDAAVFRASLAPGRHERGKAKDSAAEYVSRRLHTYRVDQLQAHLRHAVQVCVLVCVPPFRTDDSSRTRAGARSTCSPSSLWSWTRRV